MIPKNDFRLIAKLLAKLALDYIRWTQLVPMVLVWAFALIMVVLLMLTAFQGEINTLLERAEPMAERFLGPAPESVAGDPSAGEVESVTLTDDDIVPWIMRIWGAIALIGWIFSMIRTRLFGQKSPRSLKRKIGMAGISAAIFTVLLLFGFLLMGGSPGNTFFELLIPFVLLPLILIIISTWGLTISHIIDKLHQEIDKLDIGEKPETLTKTTV